MGKVKTNSAIGYEILPPEHPIELLAEQLYFRLEQLDPTDDREWRNLPYTEKELYRQCVSWLLGDRELILRGLETASKRHPPSNQRESV